MSQGEQSAGRRLGVITIDQAIAGASNVLIAVLAARLLDVASFGLFGIVFAVYVLVQGVSRAVVSDPLLVHPVEAEGREGEVIGTSFLLGLALCVVVLLAGLGVRLLDARLGDTLMVLAACVPLLVLQDLGRYLAFAAQRPARALVLDVTWLVLLAVAVAALFATDTRTLPWFIAAWGGSGAVAGLVLLTQHRVREVRLGLDWLRFTWSFSWRYLISYGSTQGAAVGVLAGVGAVAGAKALGGVQGAVLLVRPFMTFQVAAIAATIGEVTRSIADERQLRRHVLRTSVLTTGIAVVNAVVLLLVPDGVGEAMLGESWAAAEPLLLPTGLQLVCLGLMTGVRAGLLGHRAIRKVMALDVATTVVVVGATLAGAVVDGALGALWAVSVGQGLLTVAWWTIFLTDAGRAGPAAAEPAAASIPSVTVPSLPPA